MLVIIAVTKSMFRSISSGIEITVIENSPSEIAAPTTWPTARKIHPSVVVKTMVRNRSRVEKDSLPRNSATRRRIWYIHIQKTNSITNAIQDSSRPRWAQTTGSTVPQLSGCPVSRRRLTS